MWQTKRHLNVFLAVASTLCPLGAAAQDAAFGREHANAGTERRHIPKGSADGCC
jgi:hypothetical protein